MCSAGLVASTYRLPLRLKAEEFLNVLFKADLNTMSRLIKRKPDPHRSAVCNQEKRMCATRRLTVCIRDEILGAEAGREE